MLAALADVADATRQIVFAVRQTFYDVLLAEARRELTSQRLELFRQLLTADSIRLKAGDLPQRELTRSELELARAEADLTRADTEVHSTRLALQLLMGNEQPDTAFSVSGTLTYRPVAIPVSSLVTLAASTRPDLQAARARTQQSRAAGQLATATLVPAPFVSLVYQHGAPFGSGSHYAVGLGLSVPLFSGLGGERERARAGLATAELTERRTRALVANDLQTALDSYGAARRLTERYEGGLLAKSQATLDAAHYAYGSGAASLLELLDAIRTYTEIRSDYYTAVHDYWVGVFALSRAAGKDFVP